MKFRRVLDGDDTFGLANIARHGVEHRRLTAAGATGYENVETGMHDRLEKLGNFIGQRFGLDEVFHGRAHGPEFPDRNDRPVDRKRRDDSIDT